MVLVSGYQVFTSMTSCSYSSDDEIRSSNGNATGQDRRRRVHNEVERRRKDKINSWILRIGELLPDKNRKKQCINEILEQAVVYISYLKDSNDKLLQEKCSEVQVEELRRMNKRIKDLEEQNTQCLRLLQAAGITCTSCPEEFCDQKSGKYSNKITSEQASALLTQFENDLIESNVTKLKSVMQRKLQNKGSSVSGDSMDTELNCNGKTSDDDISETSIISEKSLPVSHPRSSKIDGVVSSGTISTVTSPVPSLTDNKDNQITKVVNSVSQSVCSSSPLSKSVDNCQYTEPCSSEGPNLSLDVCDITAVTQALPPVPVMSTSQNSSALQNNVQKLCKQTVASFNQVIQPQVLSPCGTIPPTANRASSIQNMSSPLIVINEHGIPVIHNIVTFQSVQPPVFSNCSSSPALLTSTNNGFGQTQSPLGISPQIAGCSSYKSMYVTKDFQNQAKITSTPTTFSVTVTPNNSVTGVPILAAATGYTSTIRPPNTLTTEGKNLLSPLVAQVPVSGSSQENTMKLSSGLPTSAIGQGTLSQIITHPSDDLTASNMHLQSCNSHNLSQNMPCNTLPPTVVTPGGILVGQPLTINQQGQVLTMGSGQILATQGSITTQQPLPSALILPNGQVIPVVSQPSVVYANPAMNNNVVLTQTGKQNIQVSNSPVTNIKNQNSPLLNNSINNNILFSPSGTTRNNFKMSSVALTLSQNVNAQPSVSYTMNNEISPPAVQQKTTNIGIDSLRPPQNDSSIISTEEELIKCTTSQTFQNTLSTAPTTKPNCLNMETNSKRSGNLNSKNGNSIKNSKYSTSGNKRTNRILKPKPTSSPQSLGLQHTKMQQTVRDVETKKQENSILNKTSANEKSNLNNANNVASCTNLNMPANKTSDSIKLNMNEAVTKVSTNNNMSSGITTDILAKATESIFSNCMSELSPSISNFSSNKDESSHSENTVNCPVMENGKTNKSNHEALLNKSTNEEKQDKKAHLYHLENSNTCNSIAESCISSQPQDLLSTLTATVFGDSSVDTASDELEFTQVDTSASKLMPTLSSNIMAKNLKDDNDDNHDLNVEKLKNRSDCNNSDAPPLKKAKTNEVSNGNKGMPITTVQSIEKEQSNCFVSNTLSECNENTASTCETSHNRINSANKCYLSEEKQFKQTQPTCVSSTSNTLSVSEVTPNVSQILLTDSSSQIHLRTAQKSPLKQNSSNNLSTFVTNGDSSASDAELPTLILGSLGDDSNTPSSVTGSSSSGLPFLTLSPSEPFSSDLHKDASHNNENSFNLLENCRQSNIEPIVSVKNKDFIQNKKTSPSSEQQKEKSVRNSTYMETNKSTHSKHSLSSNQLQEQEANISSTLSPPLLIKSNCNRSVSTQQRIVQDENISGLQKDTQCPSSSVNVRSISRSNDVNCQVTLTNQLSPVTSLSFIAPSPPPLLSRNILHETRTSTPASNSPHFSPLSSQGNFNVVNSQTQLLATTTQSQNSTQNRISPFKLTSDRNSSTPKSVGTFLNSENPSNIITSTSTVTSTTTSNSVNFQPQTTSHTLSSYSAEALIGQQSTMTSTSSGNPIVSQAHYSNTLISGCSRVTRPPISYSAESLIQTNSCIDKKQETLSKETISNNNMTSNNMNSYRHQPQHLQHSVQQTTMLQGTNIGQSIVSNVTERRLPCSNLSTSSDMMQSNSLQSNFHLQGTSPYPNLTHGITTGPQQNLMNNHFGGSPILMRHGTSACQQLDQCLPCNQPSHNSTSIPQAYSNISLNLGGSKNCHNTNAFHQNRPNVETSITQTLSSCLSNGNNLNHIVTSNSQQQNGCLFPNHGSSSMPAGPLLQMPETNFSLLSNTTSFNNQVRNDNRPPVFNNFPQHTPQNPLVNNIFHGSFVTSVNTQRNEVTNVMTAQQSTHPNEGIKQVTRDHRSSSQSQSPAPNQSKISPKTSKSNAKKNKQNSVNDEVISSTPYDNINARMSTHFSVPDLSFPRNDGPCLGNNYFSNSQRSLVPTISNIQTQNKNIPSVATSDTSFTANSAYNPIFRRQADNSLNFNFQGSSFSVNSLHRPATSGTDNISAAQISCHTSTASAHPIPNFNLSNIFPDISTSSESINLPPMKFHHNNHIITPPNSNQIQASEGTSLSHGATHQNRGPPPLYHSRSHPPVIHNSVGFNGILGPNTHSFDGHGAQMAVGINNAMGHPPPPPPPPPPFGPTHAHTPSFGNVLPPLNFPMHDH
ncbi:uncharacterized protein [Centruroides vittatus]|uniref:uncharacterized protein isoform X1 n=1 Tax=Centruroides vittatus TaxID=120091 RepID=UPI003510405F